MEMKSRIIISMQYLLFSCILAVLTPDKLNAQPVRTNFEGKWSLNTKKSSPAQGSRSDNLEVVQQDENLLVTKVTDPWGVTNLSRYTLDGKENELILGGLKSKYMAAFSKDGKTLNFHKKFTAQGREMQLTEVWSLTDPKTLMIITTKEGTSGDEMIKLVYDKW
jgi:hypothetical protein